MATFTDAPFLTERFDQALAFAHEVHRRQLKAKRSPYIGHLLIVAGYVLESGGDEDQAIAALLHDAAEDHGGRRMLAEIQKRFGAQVAHIVEGCTDDLREPPPPWPERKRNYVAHIAELDLPTARVLIADKLTNARGFLRAWRRDGEDVWQNYGGGRAGRLWYYRALADAFADAGYACPLLDELRDTVDEIERRAAATPEPA
jgi:(p)ppGpp synthase/HD superfamily hydrolase